MASRGRKTLAALVLLSALAGLGWWQRDTVFAWYYVRQLAQADEANRASWVERVVSLDEAAVPRLLASLDVAHPTGRENVTAALVDLVKRWGSEDRRSLTLLEQLETAYANLSTEGKKAALQVPIALLQQAPERQSLPAGIARPAGDLLIAAEAEDDLCVPAMRLAAALVERGPPGQWVDLSRRLALSGLEAEEAAARLAAVRLVLRGPLRQEGDLLTKLVPLLKDDSAEVRQAALIALGTSRDLVSDDDLLPLLHDPDQDVQTLCETALRSRGLQESHILLARLISDDRPGARLQVLQHLRQTSDLEPRVWLRRLCQDPAPAVRAAAIRAAASQTVVDMLPELRELAQEDPSPTIRELAGYYLSRPKLKVDID